MDLVGLDEGLVDEGDRAHDGGVADTCRKSGDGRDLGVVGPEVAVM